MQVHTCWWCGASTKSVQQQMESGSGHFYQQIQKHPSIHSKPYNRELSEANTVLIKHQVRGLPTSSLTSQKG
jgi:hypothetical protein